MSRQELIISFVLNGIVCFVTLGIVVGYFRPPADGESPQGVRSFRFYTTDSNVFSAIVCGVVFVWEIPELMRDGGESIYGLMPHWLILLKFVSTSTVVLTFFTVMFFLGPTQGYRTMLGGTSFHMHFAGPLMAFCSLCFLEDLHYSKIPGDRGYIGLGEAFVALIPTIIYSAIYLRQVVFVREKYLSDHPELREPRKDGEPAVDKNIPGWPDFYGFNRGGKWPVALGAMMIAALMIILVIRAVYNL